MRRAPVGTVRIRSFSRTNDQRAFVKVAEPNVWRLRAHVVWESANGPIPDGLCIHHRDGDKLNDVPSNLEALTVAEHLDEHRPNYIERNIRALVTARKKRRWSTKSATKHTGRPATFSEEQLAQALAAVAAGESGHAAAAKFGVPRTTVYRHIRSRR